MDKLFVIQVHYRKTEKYVLNGFQERTKRNVIAYSSATVSVSLCLFARVSLVCFLVMWVYFYVIVMHYLGLCI